MAYSFKVFEYPLCIYRVEEAGRYLETYKVYENKPAEALMERIDTDYVSKVGPGPKVIKLFSYSTQLSKKSTAHKN